MLLQGRHGPARLGDLVIPMPLIMDRGKSTSSISSSSSFASPAVSVTIECETGIFEIVSCSGRSRVTHLQGIAVNSSVQQQVEKEEQVGVSARLDACDVVFEALTAIDTDINTTFTTSFDAKRPMYTSARR